MTMKTISIIALGLSACMLALQLVEFDADAVAASDQPKAHLNQEIVGNGNIQMNDVSGNVTIYSD